jgi:hypothetical protein
MPAPLLLLLLVCLQANGDGAQEGAAARRRMAPELEDTGVVGERAMGKGAAFGRFLACGLVLACGFHRLLFAGIVRDRSSCVGTL